MPKSNPAPRRASGAGRPAQGGRGGGTGKPPVPRKGDSARRNSSTDGPKKSYRDRDERPSYQSRSTAKPGAERRIEQRSSSSYGPRPGDDERDGRSSYRRREGEFEERRPRPTGSGRQFYANLP